MNVNIWIAMRNGAHTAIRERIKWDEESQGPYTGPVPNWVGRMFETIADRATIDSVFRRDRVWFSQGAVWRDWDLWSLNFDERRENLQLLGEKLADLQSQYSGLVRVVGAWWWDGRQVGTRFDANGDIVGTPLYPLDPRLIEFMPDNADGTRPTEIADVNLVYGQSPRRFS